LKTGPMPSRLKPRVEEALRRAAGEGFLGKSGLSPSGGGGGPAQLWSWPHVEGSAVGSAARLMPFRFPCAQDASPASAWGDTQPGAATLFSKSLDLGGGGGSTYGLSGTSGGLKEGAAAAFFYFRPGAPAQAFPPAPLLPPRAPRLASDAYARELPKSPERPKREPKACAAIGRWALFAGPNGSKLMTEWARAPPLPDAEAVDALPPRTPPVENPETEAPEQGAPSDPNMGASSLEAAGLERLPLVAVGCRRVAGGIPAANLALIVRPPPPPKPPIPPKPKEPWDYELNSIFGPRATRQGNEFEQRSVTDGKSLLDLTSGAIERAAACDFDQLLAKQDRIFQVIGKDVREACDPRVVAVQEALARDGCYRWLAYIFTLRAAADIGATDAAYMNWMAYSALMEEAGVATPNGGGCDQRDLDNVFKAANFELKGSDPKDLNPLNSLNRSEWLEVVIRIAKLKFKQVSLGDASSGGGMGAAVSSLVKLMRSKLEEVAAVNSCAMIARDLRDEWRLADLYTEETDKVLRRWQPRLSRLYRTRVSKDLKAAKCWRLRTWVTLLDETGMFLDSSFTREEANLCYYLSKFTVVDPLKDAAKFEGLDWCSFLEAIARVVRFKELPSVSRLARAGVGTLPNLTRTLREQKGTWDRWMETNPETESDKEDTMPVRIDQFCQLLFYEEDRLLGKKGAT